MNIRKLLLSLFFCLSITSLFADNGSNFNANRTDFRDESIYFVITTRFYDGDTGNNVLCWDNQSSQTSTKDPAWRGDFQGLIDKLDYIKALGFTAIWVTPIVQNGSGYDYHGYHAMDFSHVDCRYQSSDGTASGDEMFQKFVNAAHKKGIKVILDIVLNHTGNFGENHFCKEFTRSTKLNLQGSTACLTPNTDILGSDYDNLTAGNQYNRRLAMMKNTDNVNHDTHNYWHHYAEFNWDEPNRWWAQIAGDCVDLNTENPAVEKYLIDCYKKYMAMGVDGFRIDTSGHIARLTFNASFIPEFTALGKDYLSTRSLYGGTTGAEPFYMFGEVCARYSGIVYRDQPNLSPYFYTWKSSEGLLSQWNKDFTFWNNQSIMCSSSSSSVVGNMNLCLQDDAFSSPNSNNAVMVNGAYHTPDYSNASGFNVIDFPVHYNFNNVSSAYNLATTGDHYYNDATWNVVYVDSHDYSPGPNDGIRFNGGTNQWADNLTWMFFFRGIPCLYYGSEVEFQKGKPIDAGTNGPLNNTGRAYFGQNLEGNVTASDFGQFTADGQVAKTLNHPLAKHIERLNRIRQAVPALRKGQYTTDGCTANGGWAWKKAYKSGSVDSYALVCMDGGATFTGIPNGTYKDCVTGDVKTVTNGTLTVSCPTNQGNARVYVLNGPGKIGEDGPFLYTSTAASADNSALATDPGTTWNEVAQATHPSMTFSPNGGSFTTETQTVTATLTNATSGWYQIGDGSKVNITGNTTFTIGSDMNYGDTKTVKWSATGDNNGTEETNTGSVTYMKVDPNAAIYCYFINSGKWNTVRTYIWDAKNNNAQYAGDWNNRYTFTSSDIAGQTSEGYDVYKWTYTGTLTNVPTGIIFTSSSDSQRAGGGDLTFVNGGYYNANGATTKPVITGIKAPTASTSARCIIYNLSGQRVAEVNSIDDAEYILKSGIYIANGRKFVIK